jgi:transcriptional regulator with XRE-family HTH domain
VVGPLSEDARRVLARKLKVLMFLHRHSNQSLAAAAGVAPARVRAAECGVGALVLDDLEKIARVLGIKVVELFLSPGRTAAERVILGLLEGEGYK